MNSSDPNQSQWDACPRGELTSMVKARRERRRNRIAWRVAMVSASLLLAGLGVYQLALMAQSGEFNYGGIACSEVQQAMANYQDRQMPPDLSRRVVLHLEHCEACRQQRDGTTGERQQATPSLALGGRHRISCDHGHRLRHQPRLVASR